MSTPTIRTFLGITLSILFIGLPSLFAGLAPNTKITTPTHMVCVESLKVGNTICGYGPTTHAFPDVKIKNIEPLLVESIYVITTKHGTITASADQLFYEITSESFIAAKQLKAGNLFLTKAIKALECISVEHKNTQTTVYDLTLEEPHLFFSSDAQVLTHNAVPILLLGIPLAAPVIKFVASVGAIAGALYIEKIATSSLPIFKECRERRERKAAHRALFASLNQAEEHPTPSNKPQTPPQPVIENSTSSGEQPPDPNDPKNMKNNNDNEIKNHSDKKDKVKTPADVINEAQLGEEKRFARQFEKSGNFNNVEKDFESLQPSEIKIHGPDMDGKIVKVGRLTDGRTVIARNRSSEENKPTLEFQNNPDSIKRIKIRYTPNLEGK